MLLFKKIRKASSHSGSELVVAIDIGTSKVCCAIASMEAPDQMKVIGVGHQVSKGLRSGNVIDMQDAELSILNAVHLAERMAKETVRSVYVSVANCQSQTVSVELPISGHSVGDTDVRRLLMQARQVTGPRGQEPIHTIPTSYDIDGRRGIRDPRGMHGDILGVNVHTIYSSTSNLRNLSTCVARCHLETKAFVTTAMASGLAVLVEDEMDLGSIVVDMGAGTTTIGIFVEGNIIYTNSVAIGGAHVTSDIARVLSTPISHAERLKTLYGSALSSISDEREVVKVPQIGEIQSPATNQISKADLVRIIRPRIEETFELVRSKLAAKGINKRVSNRVVLTGGACQLPGVQEIAAAILDKQVRVGKPLAAQTLHQSMLSYPFAACAGLLNYAYNEQEENIMEHQVIREPKNVAGRVGMWLRENI